MTEHASEELQRIHGLAARRRAAALVRAVGHVAGAGVVGHPLQGHRIARAISREPLGKGAVVLVHPHGIVDLEARVIDVPWEKGSVLGLVPPDPISTMSKCPSGVSKVETELSFLNSLVGLRRDLYL
ncbi:MAG TPA: hypothetical protein VIJ45_01480 [Coriobacteriia bacterium]